MVERRHTEVGRGVAAPELLLYEHILPALPTSVSRIRHELLVTLARSALAPERRDDIVLVLTEAAANAVVHAYPPGQPGPLYAAAALVQNRLTISVVDAGHGLRRRATPSGAGFGLPLMRALADDVQIVPNTPDKGVSVHAVFELAQVPVRRGPVRERSQMLHEYFRALSATHGSLKEDTEAVLAQASHALAEAQRRRRERNDVRRRRG